ncbi:alpha/beta fold hydrolase [Sneathiella chinensis]|uniref:Alpha/beta hydrolase n=1 Tax=Sneathiella chinensis TaxID=349750 RepID=A0ABQ5U5J3_9PROT|nr:alpha/beta fold hydrolase [Sneathiella chinensis]GLQ06950.1 alpha/beta hydrolase [Sneathiella chinensis]
MPETIETPSGLQSGFADLGTHRLFYKLQGNGPRLLLITGTNSDTRHQPSIYDAPGAGRFSLLNFDHRGMGQSTSPTEDPSMESYADDIARLLDHVGWDSAAVMGISFGGMVAQHFALRHPERVKRLVLCCTSSGGAGGASYPLHELQHLSAEGYAATIMKLMNVTHTDEWQAKYPARARQTFDYYYQGANAVFNDPVKFDAMKKQFAARAKHDLHDALRGLAVPTLVAAGKHDGVARPENAEALADVIPDARLKIFNGGHFFLREDPKAWPTVFGFLAGEH